MNDTTEQLKADAAATLDRMEKDNLSFQEKVVVVTSLITKIREYFQSPDYLCNIFNKT